MAENKPESEYLLPKAMRARYGISETTEWRWRRDPNLNFPRPLVINRRKLYRLADLEAWEAEMAARGEVA